MRLLFVLVLALLLPGLASAMTIDNANIQSDIIEETVFITYTFDVWSPTCETELRFAIPLQSSEVTFYVPGAEATLALSSKEAVITFATCPVAPVDVFLKLRTTTPLSFNTGMLQYTFSSPFETLDSHKVLLAFGTNESDFIFVSPTSYVYAGGDVPSITWMNSSERAFVVQMYYDEPASFWIVGIITLLAVIIVGVGVYAAYLRFIVPVQSKRKVDELLAKCNVLQEKEQQIMREIITNPGIYQHTLLKKLDLMKSNGSKLISKLEFRGLIERKRLGKINALYPGESLK